MAEDTTNETQTLEQITGADVRSVAVIWTSTEVDGEVVERAQLEIFGMGEYEAAGILRATLKRLDKHNADTIEWVDENIADEEDEYDDED